MLKAWIHILTWKQSVNIRAIRNNINEDDYAPIKISIVSIDDSNKEYDRDEFKYSQFLLNGKRIIDRITKMNLDVPNKGKVLYRYQIILIYKEKI